MGATQEPSSLSEHGEKAVKLAAYASDGIAESYLNWPENG
jgi:hypothetical protein